jgi:hypothetical protein
MPRYIASGGTDLYHALLAEGFALPDNTADIQLEMPVDGAFCLHYRIMLTNEDLQKFGRALERVGKRFDDPPPPPTPISWKTGEER